MVSFFHLVSGVVHASARPAMAGTIRLLAAGAGMDDDENNLSMSWELRLNGRMRRDHELEATIVEKYAAVREPMQDFG